MVGQTSRLPPAFLDPRGIRYNLPPPHLSAWELAKELKMYHETVHRWCKQWFGPLPAGRRGEKQGYRIPLEYRRVARVWQQTEDRRIRRVAHKALVDDPKDWVVVVDNLGSTHYSYSQVVERVESLVMWPTFTQARSPLTVLYVGAETEQVDQANPSNQ